MRRRGIYRPSHVWRKAVWDNLSRSWKKDSAYCPVRRYPHLTIIDCFSTAFVIVLLCVFILSAEEARVLIKKIHVVKYRKLQDMDFDLSKGINVISGTNGTCKTSLLHMVSNAYQAVTKKCDWLQDAACLDVIKQINSMTNPKIESLTKGDKTYNDPANGAKGTLFTVDYYGQASLEFRKHNSKLSSRYAVKPWYRPGTTEKLPFCPVIYLGLTRLYPFGEYLNDEAVEKLKKNLPVAYQNEIADIL